MNVLPQSRMLLPLSRISNITLNSPENCVLLQFVRWRKKQGTPRAPSKYYYVREPTPKDPEEIEELLWRTNHYKTETRAIRRFLKEERRQDTREEKSVLVQQKIDQEFADLLEENRIWNEKVGQEREKYFAELRDKERQEQLSEIARLEQVEAEKLQEREELVKMEREKVSSFITEEDLDNMIEIALNTRRDYNFALDEYGNKMIKGVIQNSDIPPLETSSAESSVSTQATK